MALIKCLECGKEVSESAISCPNCGVGIKKNSVFSNKLLIGAVVTVMALVAIGTLIYRSLEPEYVRVAKENQVKCLGRPGRPFEETCKIEYDLEIMRAKSVHK